MARIVVTRRGVAALAGASSAVALSVAVLIKPWEGREYVAYRDMVGKLTICDGDTKNVSPGMVATDAECDRRLMDRLNTEFVPALQKCIVNFDRLPLSLRASLISGAWNHGTRSMCNSTAARMAIAGKYREACEAATAFNRAGGKVVKGLVNRREMGDEARIGEGELCVSGL